MRKEKTNTYESDKALLLASMEQTINGTVTPVSPELFQDRELAERYNNLLEYFLVSNNAFVMKLNDSMRQIGDSSSVKEMIEQVNSQTASINSMSNSSRELGTSIQNIQSAVQKIQENSHSIISTTEKSIRDMNGSIKIVGESAEKISDIHNQVEAFKEKAIKINEIIDMVKKIASRSNLLALNASIEAARAGTAGKGFSVVADQMRELSTSTTKSAEDVVVYVNELMEGINSLSDSVENTTSHLKAGNENVHKSVSSVEEIGKQLNDIRDSIDSIYEEINNQSALTQSFVSSTTAIARSYETLSEECSGTGKHLYKISRNIDKVRSDMARKNSKLSVLDWITVFEIDHIIFTWRIYNNLAGFETLKLEQVNNPKGCKLGKWINFQTDPLLTQSKEYKKVYQDHEEIHKYAVESWNAMNCGDREEALVQFQHAYSAFEKFIISINALKDFIRKNIDSTETPLLQTF